MELLNRARKINSMLQKSAGMSVNFTEMSETLSNVIKGNIFILNRDGKLLGHAINEEIDNERMKNMLEERQFPEEYTQGLFNIIETTPDRKSTRLNSSHVAISYAVFCLKEKNGLRRGPHPSLRIRA